MPTDYDILHLHLVNGWSKENIAQQLGHRKSSVVGRVSRAATLENLTLIAQAQASSLPTVNTGLLKQRAILKRSQELFNLRQAYLRQRGGLATAVFASDMHVPYTNWAAFLLTLYIVQHLQPDYFSAFNDFFDFEGFSRWEDTRSPAQRLWSDDINNALRVAKTVHTALNKAAPNMMLLQVQGNHDNWMYHYIRTVARTGFSEHDVAYFMRQIEKQNVVQFSNGEDKKENIIQLSPGLKWVHGVSASKNGMSVAKAVQDTCRGREEDGEEGVYYYTVAGHTHRAGEYPINGVKHWNSGTLGTHDPRYTKHRPHWDTAIVINRYDPNSRYVEGDVVWYKQRGGHLVARYDGIEFDVPLKDKT